MHREPRNVSPPAAGARGALPFAVAAVTFATAWGGIALTAGVEKIALIWVANAIMLALCLRQPTSVWPRLFVGFMAGIFVANLTMVNGLVLSAAFAVLNGLEVALIAIPMRLLKLSDFTRPRTLTVFYPLAVGPATLVSASLAAGVLHGVTGSPFLSQAETWYASDVLGLVTLTPLLASITWSDVRRQLTGPRAPLNFVILAAISLLSYIGYFETPPHPFIVFPPLVLVTFRMGFAGGVAMLAVAGGLLIAAIVLGVHPLAGYAQTFHGQIYFAQFFIALASFTIQQIGSALAERSRLESSLKMSNAELRTAKDRAEAASAVKSAFLANMSHELRTPLNAIIGFSEVMEKEMFGALGSPRYKQYSEIVGSSGRHLLELINDVLDLSRLDAGKTQLHEEEFDLNAVLAEAFGMMTAQAAAASLSLQKTLMPSPFIIRADRRRILQIALNLLANAVKFTPEKGTVAILTRRAGGGVQFLVSDSGIGIASHDIAKVLTPFGQVDSGWSRKYAGTGLGLPLAKQLAELHGGTLAIDSAVNVGTTVTVSLPPERVLELRAVA